MLKDIEKAINKVLSDLDAKIECNNETMCDRATLATVLSVEVLRELTTETPEKPKPQRKPRKAEPEESPPVPVDKGTIRLGQVNIS